MPVFNSDGILGNTYQVFPSSAQLTALTVSGTMSSATTTTSNLTSLTYINQGTQTYSITIANPALGAGYSANLSQNTVSILNTGSITTLSSAFIGVSSIIGNGLLTAGDICSLFVEGPPNVTNLANGGIYALKVNGTSRFSDNLQIGGNLTLTGSLTSSGAISTTGTITSTNATDSSSPTTGSVILSGGLGVQKNLSIGGSLNLTGGIAITAGKLIYSVRAPITSGTPYTLNFATNDNYSVIPVQSATAFILIVPSGVDGQVLIIINIGAGNVTVSLTVEGAAETPVLNQSNRMSLIYYSGSWRSLV